MKDIYDLLSNGKKNIYKSHFKKQSKWYMCLLMRV